MFNPVVRQEPPIVDRRLHFIEHLGTARDPAIASDELAQKGWGNELANEDNRKRPVNRILCGMLGWDLFYHNESSERIHVPASSAPGCGEGSLVA